MEHFAKEPTMRPRLAAAPTFAAILAAAFLAALLTTTNAGDNKPKAPGLGDPGRLTAIQVETGRAKDGGVTISGRDGGQQLVVTGQFDSGQTRDWTRKATFDVAPAGIVT